MAASMTNGCRLVFSPDPENKPHLRISPRNRVAAISLPPGTHFQVSLKRWIPRRKSLVWIERYAVGRDPELHGGTITGSCPETGVLELSVLVNGEGVVTVPFALVDANFQWFETEEVFYAYLPAKKGGGWLRLRKCKE